MYGKLWLFVGIVIVVLLGCQKRPLTGQSIDVAPTRTNLSAATYAATETAVPALAATPLPTHTLEAEGVMVNVGEEFVLAMGETAVVRNSDLIIRNDGEGSEYYDDENGNEVHVYNIKLDMNGEIVWLDDTMPELAIGNYVIQWQVGNRLLVVEHEANE